MDSIIEKSYDIDLNESDEILKFYNENRLYFDNYDIITDFETIEEIVFIKQKYIEAIERKSHYSDAIMTLEHIFILLDKVKDKSIKYESYYERALFYKGVVLGRQEKYSESNEIFKKLIVIDPKSEKYQDWYLNNKHWILTKKINFWEYFLFPLLFLDMFFGDKLFGRINIIISIILLTLFIGLTFYQRFYRKIHEKRKKTNMV